MVVNFWPALGPKTGIEPAAARGLKPPGGPPTPRAGKIERVYRLIGLPKAEDGISQRHGPKAQRIKTIYFRIYPIPATTIISAATQKGELYV